MKREIKFRGKDTRNGEWAYGSIVLDAGGNTRIAVIDKSGNGLNFPYAVPETVGQFTGLQDKNGVDIYEGDILKIHHEYYDIRFAETAFCLFGRFGMWGSVARMIAVCKDIEAEIHVVGNIHDNPELLTK